MQWQELKQMERIKLFLVPINGSLLNTPLVSTKGVLFLTHTGYYFKDVQRIPNQTGPLYLGVRFNLHTKVQRHGLVGERMSHYFFLELPHS